MERVKSKEDRYNQLRFCISVLKYELNSTFGTTPKTNEQLLEIYKLIKELSEELSNIKL